jgi:DNA phosphorothioation-dependent restriction protein DptH
MTAMVAQVAKLIRDRVQQGVYAHPEATSEWRMVFNGPPVEFLGPVFELLSSDGGILVEQSNGAVTKVPVLLQSNDVVADPLIGQSGRCTADHLLNLRNSPACPKFVALVPPGQHASLSFVSASGEFGLTAANNAGNAGINDWLADDLVQQLIEHSLKRLPMSQERDREQARALIRESVRAADEAERHAVARHGAWRVLSRVFSIPSTGRAADWLSLACGYPPTEDGVLSSEEQSKILERLAAHLEEHGITVGIKELKAEASEADVSALDSLSIHLVANVELLTAMGRAAPYYYGPSRQDTLEEPPPWWQHLTLEKWTELLEEERRPTGAMRLDCINAIFRPFRGGHSVVQSEAQIEVLAPDDTEGPVDAVLTRMTGGRSGDVVTQIHVEGVVRHLDQSIPKHRTPVRYAATSQGLKKATIKVISLATWEAGFFVFSPNARKTTPPKRNRAKSGPDLECSLMLDGNGRHYMMVYARPTVEFEPLGRREDETGEAPRDVAIMRVNDAEWGFEAEVAGECHYDLKVRDGGDWQSLRIYLSSEDVAMDGCKTEFDRLVRLNRQSGSRFGNTEVQVDRNVRCADLQSWILSNENIEDSFYPLVMSVDYAANWRPPGWKSAPEAILSRAKFLHDPRPAREEFDPPAGFIEARKALAKQILGVDGNGLVESAALGEWLAQEDSFAETLQKYLSSYNAWLESDPDVAPWVDTILVCGLEQDRATLRQEPDAVLLTPIHPVRLAWHAVAQRVLFQSYRRNKPCPAASILDPDAVPDTVSLPMRSASGSITQESFLSLECGSDYWSVLWNGKRLESLASLADQPPFDNEFGVRVGGLSSGFSLSQVRRALDDVSEMLSAKPVLRVLVSSATGHTNACNEGISEWSKARLGPALDGSVERMGPRMLQIFDFRGEDGRPQDAEVSNLAEDTNNAVKWYGASQETFPADLTTDLGIIAQLKVSNARSEPVEVGSPLGWGALVRHRVRRQLPSADGAFLSESRVGIVRGPSGDALADKLCATVAKLEGLGNLRTGFVFAPAVNTITEVSDRADFTAISSAAVDPACFLGKWLPGFLWDYDLPSYSHRSGDTNGYYLISKIKATDRESLVSTLKNLPGGGEASEASVDAMILEVARRGIPTVRGLSSGTPGAAGDLGLFIAARLLQDAFRANETEPNGLLSVLTEENEVITIGLIIPVDPFRGYLDDLRAPQDEKEFMRPDLLVAGIRLSPSSCRIKLTPIEVKFRTDTMTAASAKEALAQAKALSRLMLFLEDLARDPELVAWRLAFQHLLTSMLGFGFRVYSQQRLAANQSKQWTDIHSKVIGAVLSDEAKIEVDRRGRLLILDKASLSGAKDIDEDGFEETLSLSAADAATVLFQDKPEIYALMKARLGHWDMLPPTSAPAPITVKAPVAIGSESAAPKKDAQATELPKPFASPAVDTMPGGLSNTSDAAPLGIRFQMGTTTDGFRQEPRYFNPSDTNLNQLNIGVVGDLGTGKTQLLKALIFHLASSADSNRGIRPRILIFDYKRDYSDPDFVAAVGARVVKPHRLPVNVFDIRHSPESLTPWLDRFNFFSDILDKVYSGIGPVQRRGLKAAVKRAYEMAGADGRQPTIYDVSATYAEMLDGKADSPSAILEDMVDRELFHPEPDKAEPIERFLDGVVVIDLASLGQDDRAKNTLVAIMLNLFYEQMLRIPKRPFEGIAPQLRAIDSFLLVDEADNIMRYEFDVLRKVLLQGREFGVGVILASQYLRHFKSGSTDYREPLLTWFIHKVPNVTPGELQALGMASEVAELAERIKSLPKHHCLYKTQGVSGDVILGTPFYKLRGGS